jgi:hypothetical protein
MASRRLSSLLALEISEPGGQLQIGADLRALIRRMSVENLLWGAPRIYGELLKLGFAVAQSTIAKYLHGRRRKYVKGPAEEPSHQPCRDPD